MADFKLQPLEDRIVVQANEGDQTTASGLGHPGHREGKASRRRKSWPQARA